MEFRIPVILNIIPYIDSVWILIRNDDHFNNKDKAELEQLCRSVRSEIIDARRSRLGYKWCQRVKLQVPSDEAFLWLDKRYCLNGDDRILTTRVDCSLDYIVHNIIEAEELQGFFESHLIQLWHRESVVNHDKGTIYYRENGSRNNFAMYPDKPSKITDQPSFHLESRIISADALRRINIFTIMDLVDFDHYEYWRARLLLNYPVPYDVGKAFVDKGRAKKPIIKHWGPINMNMFERVGSTVLRSTQTAYYPYSVQELLDDFIYCDKKTKRRIRRCLKNIENDNFLPAKKA